jgi:hypothetical protein
MMDHDLNLLTCSCLIHRIIQACTKTGIEDGSDDDSGSIELATPFTTTQFRLYIEYCRDQLGQVQTGMTLSALASQLHTIFNALQSDPNISKEAIMLAMEADSQFPAQLTPKVLDNIISVMVKLTMMISSSPVDYSSHILVSQPELGTHDRSWEAFTGFCDFVRESFPLSSSSILRHPDDPEYTVHKSELQATNLQRCLGLQLIPTNNLRDHLCLDRRRRALKIFHHAGVLKYHLRLTKCLPKDASFEDSIKL